MDDEPRVTGPGFYDRVYDAVRTIPAGRLSTYGDVATVLGSPRVARQVGWALAALRGTEHDVPWQRVINVKGRISFKGDSWRAEAQAQLLLQEGIVFDDTGRCDLAHYRWHWPLPG